MNDKNVYAFQQIQTILWIWEVNIGKAKPHVVHGVHYDIKIELLS